MSASDFASTLGSLSTTASAAVSSVSISLNPTITSIAQTATSGWDSKITSLAAEVSSLGSVAASQSNDNDAQLTYLSVKASLAILSNQRILATATQSQVIASATAAIADSSATLKEVFDEANQYGEIPSLGGNLTFLVIFAILLVSQSGISFYYKQWWFGVAMFCGLALETAGFIGRTCSHSNATIQDFFLLQIISLTIAPAFIMGAIYILLGKFIVVYGTQFALMRPMFYSYFFMACDILSLVIQSIGGALASSADTKADNEAGTHIMVGGIAFQVVSMTIYAFLFVHYFWSIKFHNKSKHTKLEYTQFNTYPDYVKLRQRKLFKLFPYAVGLAVFFVYIRCVYRLVELIEGWSGYLITHEIYLFTLDALMIALACTLLLVFHPGFAFDSRNINIKVTGIKKAKKMESFDMSEGKPAADFEDVSHYLRGQAPHGHQSSSRYNKEESFDEETNSRY